MHSGISTKIISRSPHAAPFSQQIGEALATQGARMDRAAAEEKARKAAAASAAADATRKRPSSASNEEASASKRPKIEQNPAASTSAAFLAGFDFTSLPAALITELIVANLQAFTEPALTGLVQAYRHSNVVRNVQPTITTPAPAEPAPVASSSKTAPAAAPAPAPPPVAPAVKEEPLDPLKMDIDEDELEYEPDRINYEVSIVIQDCSPVLNMMCIL